MSYKHTPEPWVLGYPGEEDETTIGTIYSADRERVQYTKAGEKFPKSIVRLHWGCSCCDAGPAGMSEEDRANGLRILACVNACAGIADPAKALELAREAISDTLASINFMLADGSALAANSIARDVVRGYLTNAPNKLEAALAALTPEEEK